MDKSFFKVNLSAILESSRHLGFPQAGWKIEVRIPEKILSDTYV